MNALAHRFIDEVDAEIGRLVNAVPLPELARRTGVSERVLKSLKYKEQAKPSAETRANFGFTVPSVGSIYAYWGQRMTQPDFFQPETQAAFWRDHHRHTHG